MDLFMMDLLWPVGTAATHSATASSCPVCSCAWSARDDSRLARRCHQRPAFYLSEIGPGQGEHPGCDQSVTMFTTLPGTTMTLRIALPAMAALTLISA